MRRERQTCATSELAPEVGTSRMGHESRSAPGEPSLRARIEQVAVAKGKAAPSTNAEGVFGKRGRRTRKREERVAGEGERAAGNGGGGAPGALDTGARWRPAGQGGERHSPASLWHVLWPWPKIGRETTTQLMNTLLHCAIDVTIPVSHTDYATAALLFVRNPLDNCTFQRGGTSDGQRAYTTDGPLFAMIEGSTDAELLSTADDPDLMHGLDDTESSELADDQDLQALLDDALEHPDYFQPQERK